MDLAERLHQLLSDRGPLPLLAAAGLLETSVDALERARMLDHRFLEIEDEIQLSRDVLVGLSFTALPAPDGSLPLYRDLTVLLSLGNHIKASYGGRTRALFFGGLHYSAAQARSGPLPWTGVERVAVRIDSVVPARVSVSLVQRREPTDLECAALRSVVDAHLERAHEDVFARNLANVVLSVARDHPAIFREPGATVSELLDRAGYTRIGGASSPDDLGLDEDGRPCLWSWEPSDEQRPPTAAAVAPNEQVEVLKRLIPGMGKQADELEEAVRQGPPFDAGRLGMLLRTRDARACLFGLGAELPNQVEALAQAVLAAQPRHPGAMHALAAAALGGADADRAESVLEGCVALEGTHAHEQVLTYLAELRSERGDLRGALGLYDRLDYVEDAAEELRSLATGPTVTAGRNDPCPCGSGRKFKRCCSAKQLEPDAGSLMRWVNLKLEAWVETPRNRPALLEAIDAMGLTVLHDGEGPLWLLARDDVLFEGALAKKFLRERGHRLPEVERKLIKSWLDSRLDIYEVASTAGRRTTLRPIGKDSTVDAVAPMGFEPGTILLTRIVPGPDGEPTLRITVEVPRIWRPHIWRLVREGEIWEAVATMAELRSGPRVQTTDGQDIVFCEGVFGVDEGIEALLDAAYESRGEGEWTWTNAKGRVAAALELEGGKLRVRTMSKERWSAVVATLGEAGCLEDYQERSPEEASLQSGPPSPVREAPPAEIAQALAEHARQLEQEWVNGSVPALGGLTPREALSSPRWRVELAELLRDFDMMARDDTGMNPENLREMLGIGAART